MPYEKIEEKTSHIYCLACRRTCLVLAAQGSKRLDIMPTWLFRLISPFIYVGIRLRDFRSDGRFRYPTDGAVNGVRMPDGDIVKIFDRGEFCSQACSMEFRSRIERKDPTVDGWTFDPAKQDPWAS
jgi:hypothetical protein